MGKTNKMENREKLGWILVFLLSIGTIGFGWVNFHESETTGAYAAIQKVGPYDELYQSNLEPGVCGDKVCNINENHAKCPGDCIPRCGVIPKELQEPLCDPEEDYAFCGDCEQYIVG